MSCAGTVHRVEAEAVVAAWVFSIGVDVSHRRCYCDGGSRPKQAVRTPRLCFSHFQLYDISVKVVLHLCKSAFLRKL